ncbi:MAG: hypothetical protein ACQETG_11000, partial [Thermodesulfobacteriota bacterium]
PLLAQFNWGGIPLVLFYILVIRACFVLRVSNFGFFSVASDPDSEPAVGIVMSLYDCVYLGHSLGGWKLNGN